MELNFHYYVTHSAARVAGFSDDEAITIAQAARYVDENIDNSCPSTQTNPSLLWENFSFRDAAIKKSLKKVLEIWPVFHFLPGNFDEIKGNLPDDFDKSKDNVAKVDEVIISREAYKLICIPGGNLSLRIIEDAKLHYWLNNIPQNQRLYRVGVAMHVLADTFAHQRFAGFPQASINDVGTVWLTGVEPEDALAQSGLNAARWKFAISGKDTKHEFGDKTLYEYSYAPAGISEQSLGYLGHGRIGHMPDLPGMVFGYKPNWAKDKETEKAVVYQSNPLEYHCAFEQMVIAMKYIRNESGYTCVDKEEVMKRYYGGYKIKADNKAYQSEKDLMSVFSKMGDDDALPGVWMENVNALPPKYTKPADIPEFLKAAKAHKEAVLSLCEPLRKMIEWHS